MRTCHSLLVATVLCAGPTCSGPIKVATGVVVKNSFRPTLPPETMYGDTQTRQCPSGPVLTALNEFLSDVPKAWNKPAPVADGRLCAAATTLLGWTKDDAPPESVSIFVTRYFGLTAPATRFAIATLPAEDPRRTASRLFENLGRLAREAERARFGFALQQEKDRQVRLVLLMQDDLVTWTPFLRQMGLKSQISISGSVPDAYSKPVVTVHDVNGREESFASPVGQTFVAKAACNEKPGTLSVVVRAQTKEGEKTLASFPVSCGVSPPFAVSLPNAMKEPIDDTEKELRLFDLINNQRSATGLSSLVWDSELAAIARRFSEGMREQDRLGTEPTLPNLIEQLKAAEIVSTLVLHNPARARSTFEAHSLILNNQIQRTQLLNPEVNAVGVGVATEAKTDGAVTVYVNEVFVRQRLALDSALEKEKLRQAIEQKRLAANVNPLAYNKALEELAETYARELAANKGAVAKSRADEILAPMNKVLRNGEIVAGAKLEILSFANDPAVVSSAELYGLGVAQGTHPNLGKNALFVVLILGIAPKTE